MSNAANIKITVAQPAASAAEDEQISFTANESTPTHQAPINSEKKEPTLDKIYLRKKTEEKNNDEPEEIEFVANTVVLDASNLLNQLKSSASVEEIIAEEIVIKEQQEEPVQTELAPQTQPEPVQEVVVPPIRPAAVVPPIRPAAVVQPIRQAAIVQPIRPAVVVQPVGPAAVVQPIQQAVVPAAPTPMPGPEKKSPAELKLAIFKGATPIPELNNKAESSIPKFATHSKIVIPAQLGLESLTRVQQIEMNAKIRVAMSEAKTYVLAEAAAKSAVLEFQVNQVLAKIYQQYPDTKNEIIKIQKLLSSHSKIKEADGPKES
jgi:hypothetical protein